jgi:hypothetical protein
MIASNYQINAVRKRGNPLGIAAGDQRIFLKMLLYG